MSASGDYRTLMKSILMVGFFLPFVPMVLVGGIVYHQYGTACEELVNAVPQDAEVALDGLARAEIVTAATILLAGMLIAVNAYGLARKTVRRIEEADARKQEMTEQMFQTGKLASIGELASGIAHEINNPVAIMVQEAGWMDDLLEDEEFGESQNLGELKRALKQIRTQGARCKDITHSLLSFARETNFTVQPVQLGGLIEDVVAMSVKSARPRDVSISVDIEEGLPELSLPRTEMQQVLLNLIKNALDAMEDGSGNLAVSAHLVMGNLVIRVSDDGPGIPEADQKRIFDPFYTTKPLGKGTGLGLSICYGIVKKMGGEIGVESSAAVGTTFSVLIPVSETAQDGVTGSTDTRS